MMSPEDQTALTQHAREIAKILHRNTNPETIETFEGIELAVRQQILEYVSPEIGIFLSKNGPRSDEDANDK